MSFTEDAKNAIEVAERGLHALLSSFAPFGYQHADAVVAIMKALDRMSMSRSDIDSIEAHINEFTKTMAKADATADAELEAKFKPTATPPQSAGNK